MGRRFAARLDDAPAPAVARRARQRWRARFPTAVLGLAVAALTVAIAWPASTPPVLGPDGRPVPGSIAELATVRLGGVDQTVMIRAANPDAPVLLYLAGGPGQSDLALTRVAAEPWVDDVVFVDWDQRGTGKSYAAMEPVSALTLEQAVADTIELTEILRDRFDERRIYLMGESWGSILGVLAVQRRPDLYYAWIGSGQMVNVVETDRRVYRDLVDYAARTGDGALAAKLAEIGEPPYRDIPWANANLLAWYEYLYAPYTPSPGYLARGEAGGLDPFGILGSEYDLVEKTTVLRGPDRHLRAAVSAAVRHRLPARRRPARGARLPARRRGRAGRPARPGPRLVRGASRRRARRGSRSRARPIRSRSSRPTRWIASSSSGSCRMTYPGPDLAGQRLASPATRGRCGPLTGCAAPRMVERFISAADDDRRPVVRTEASDAQPTRATAPPPSAEHPRIVASHGVRAAAGRDRGRARGRRAQVVAHSRAADAGR